MIYNFVINKITDKYTFLGLPTSLVLLKLMPT